MSDTETLDSLLAEGRLSDAKSEVLLKTESSAEVPTQLSVSPMPEDGSESISAVVTDLTEHKRTEAELETYRDHLEELVAQRTDQLQTTMEELETTNEELQVVNEELLSTAADMETASQELVREIEDRKMIEQDLRDSEARFRAVFDSTQDAIVVANDDGVYIDANPAVMSIFGVPANKLLGRRILDFVEEGSEADEAWTSFLRRGRKSAQLRILRPDGSVKIVAMHSIANILPGRHLSVLHDITERVELDGRREELLQRERHIADVLQGALIPEASFDIPGCDVAVRYEPALKEAEVGGDFYDIFNLDGGAVGILIGDVVGKGLSAASRVAAARHSVRSYAYLDPSPSKVMSLTNNALCRTETDQSSMVTGFFAVFDTRTGRLRYANGGHESAIIRHPDGSITELELEGRALGVYKGYEYQEAERAMQPGDTLVMVTDGITEARPCAHDLFGIEGVKKHVASQSPYTSVDRIADGVLRAAKKHAGGALKDDAVIVVFRSETPVHCERP